MRGSQGPLRGIDPLLHRVACRRAAAVQRPSHRRRTPSPRHRRPMTYNRALNDLVQQESKFIDDILTEVGRVIVGQNTMVERLLIGLLAGGHVLLEGVPGLAKTLTVAHALRRAPGAVRAHPVHARPAARRPHRHAHLPPAGRRRSPPRRARSSPTSCSPTRSTARPPRCRARCSRPCRSARSPSATRPSRCPIPFLVLATQNPIEQEGTYPLPEAQVDRFMLEGEGRLPDPRGRARDHGPADRRLPRRRSRRKVTPEQILAARAR